jgi:hypothetical protein
LPAPITRLLKRRSDLDDVFECKCHRPFLHHRIGWKLAMNYRPNLPPGERTRWFNTLFPDPS